MGKRRPANAPKVKEVPREAKVKIIESALKEYTKCIKQAMRENKISDERSDKIIIQAIDLINERGEQ